MSRDFVEPEVRKYIYEHVFSKKMRKYVTEDMLSFHFYGERAISRVYFEVGNITFRYSFNYRGIGESINTTQPLKMQYNDDTVRRFSYGWHRTFTSTVYEAFKEINIKLLSDKI